MSSVGEQIQVEIKRNQELKKMYDDIPTGFIGASLIQQDIDDAVKALAEGDIIKILLAYEKLKNNE
jgi:hypothetical protein